MKLAFPKIDNDAEQKMTTSTSARKEETIETVSTILNLNVQSSNLITKYEKKKKGLLIIELHQKKNGQLTSSMKIKTKRRSNSFDEELSKQHSKDIHKKRLARRSSVGDIDHVHVTHVLTHPTATKSLPVDDIRPSIIESTIRLDDVDENLQSASLVEMNDTKTPVKTALPRTLRTTDEPRPSQIDTIHLTSTNSKVNISAASTDNDEKYTAKGVHVKHIKTIKKKTKPTTTVAPLHSVIEEEKKDNNDHE
ncbi:unnamed protein product [Rotaria sordida]|nr:unnamed protein product [Rotaria sordida]